MAIAAGYRFSLVLFHRFARLVQRHIEPLTVARGALDNCLTDSSKR